MANSNSIFASGWRIGFFLCLLLGSALGFSSLTRAAEDKPGGGCGHKDWMDTAKAEVKRNLASLDVAKDAGDFFGSYYSQSSEQTKIDCWVGLVFAMGDLENGCKAAGCSPEPTLSKPSCGLMQLSAGECPEAPTNKALMDPNKNLTCAIRKMGKLIKRDGCISGPCGKKGKGAAAYWSVLRKPYTVKKMRLGKIAKIKEISQRCMMGP